MVDDVPVRHDGGDVAGAFDMHLLHCVLDLRLLLIWTHIQATSAADAAGSRAILERHLAALS